MERSSSAELRDAARQVMIEAGFDPDFPPAVLREVAELPESAPTAGAARDMRRFLWSSIDNRGTRDVDQLAMAEPQGESIRVFVAIADVDALVPKGSHTDAHAAVNTTSVYTGIAVFPMLPERLSAGLTSFRADEDRLAVVVAIDVTPEGALARVDAFRALVRNRARLTYNAVDGFLVGGEALAPVLRQLPGLEEQLRLQIEAARRLVAFRQARGTLSADALEAAPVTANGEVIDVALPQRSGARDVVESLMVATNSAVARWLEERRVPALRRVVRTPRRWDRLVQLAGDIGAQLPAEPNSGALGDFLTRRAIADPDHFPDLALTVSKLLGPGEYMLERRFDGRAEEGNFAVDAAEYTHSTAPNRRFVDLIVQRLVKFACGETPTPYDERELIALARHCTEQEDAARKVERSMRKRAAAIFMVDRIGDSFPAIVTGASRKGTYVRLLRPPVEGRVIKGERDLDVGDTVRVRLIGVDPARGYIDFQNTAGDETHRKLERSRRKKQTAARLAPRIGEQFDAVVTKAAPDGTYVRLTSDEGEGRVVRGERGLVVGAPVRVTLIATDPVHGFVDFEYREGVAPRKMERRRRKQEWAALLRDAVGTRYDALVTGVTPKATWIRTIQPEVEGRLVRGTRGLAIGDRVRVVLLATDASRGWIDFARERIGAGAAEEGAP